MGGVEKYLNPLDTLSGLAGEYQRQWERQEDIDREQANRQQDIATQYDFAKNALTWQYSQMNQAGLNPAASISGANSPAFMPASGGGSHSQGPSGGTVGLKWASQSQRKEEQLRIDLLQEQVKRAGLENDALKKSMEPTPKMATTKAKIEPKMGIDPKGAEWVTFVSQPDHGVRPVPSEALKQLIEDSPYETEHWLKEGLLPRLGINTSTKPPRDDFMRKNDIFWIYDAGRGAYYKQTRPKKKKIGNFDLIKPLDPDYHDKKWRD